MSEITLATEGQRPHRVRVYVTATATGAKLVRIEWREQGKRVRESRPDTKPMRAWALKEAKAIAARLLLGQQKSERGKVATMQEVVDAYLAENSHWRSKTLDGATNKMNVWLAYALPHTRITAVNTAMVTLFRKYLRTTVREKTGEPMAPNQVRRHANEVKSLLRFAKENKLVAENPLADYRVKLGKEEKELDVPEYTNEEWAAILGALDMRNTMQWRAWCLTMLAGILGPRQNAVMHLTWDDVDLMTRETEWPSETDKMGTSRVQPMPRDAVLAFRVAQVWRARDGYTGPFVFYSVKRSVRDKQPYTYQALNYQIAQAEKRAGVAHIKYRSMHGFRRTSMGNALQASGGNLKEAMEWIGDRDLKSAQKYLKKRAAHQQALARQMGAPSPAGPKPPRTATKKPTKKKPSPKQRGNPK